MSETINRRASFAITGIAVVLATHYWGWGGEYARSDIQDLRAAVERASAAGDSLRSERDSLSVWGDSLETDPTVIERIARERYAFIRPGEQLYLFVEEQEPETGDDDESEP